MSFFACFAVLAVVAQASACPRTCGLESQSYGYSSSPAYVSAVPQVQTVQSVQAVPSIQLSQLAASAGSQVQSIPTNLPTFDVSGMSASASERVDRNTYRVSLDNTGPNSVNCGPVVRSQQQAPAIQRPTVTLPARIPGARCISNQCKCVKTIVKPQVCEQIITVPIVQRYIQTSHRPVVEKIHYQAVPVNAQDVQCAPGTGAQGIQLGGQGIQLGAQSVQVQVPTLQVQSAPRYEVQAAPALQVQSVQSAPCLEQTQGYQQVAMQVGSGCDC